MRPHPSIMRNSPAEAGLFLFQAELRLMLAFL